MNINTLVQDIYATLEGTQKAQAFSPLEITEALQHVYARATQTKERPDKTLYFSEVGTSCPRALHYRYHSPELAEAFNGTQRLKFFYGDILESVVLSVAEAAGHTVESRQKPLILELSDGWKVRGKIDAVVDGVLIDVKSVTKYSEQKFADGLPPDQDSFGYRLQLGGYATAMGVKEAGFLTISKELGKLGYYPIEVEHGVVLDNMEKAVEAVKSKLEDLPRLSPVPDGKSGNEKLCTICSYCSFKTTCYPEAKKFIYSRGPVWLTTIKRQPKVESDEVL